MAKAGRKRRRIPRRLHPPLPPRPWKLADLDKFTPDQLNKLSIGDFELDGGHPDLSPEERWRQLQEERHLLDRAMACEMGFASKQHRQSHLSPAPAQGLVVPPKRVEKLTLRQQMTLAVIESPAFFPNGVEGIPTADIVRTVADKWEAECEARGQKKHSKTPPGREAINNLIGRGRRR
jgi:hypothetical protein